MTSKGQDKIYAIVQAQYTEALQAGVVPWHQGWKDTGAPRSMATGKPYRGSNIFLLAALTAIRGYTSPWWGTYDQITREGGQVRAGEHGTIIVKWQRRRVVERDELTGEDEVKIFYNLFYFKVFNAGQAHGLPAKWHPKPGDQTEFEQVPGAEQILKSYLAGEGAPDLAYDGGGRAYYVPSADIIHLPRREAFAGPDEFYGTAFHECAHSTGHETRLARPGVTDQFSHFGSDKYGKEELVAEMTAGFLAALTGTDGHFSNSAAYVGSWLATIKGDPKLVIQAAGQAARAADMIQGITWDNEEES